MKFLDRFFFYPDRSNRGTPADARLPFKDVFFTASDSTRLHAWFLPSTDSTPRGCVLHLHGNAANVTGHWPFVAWLPRAGYSVLTLDYRGFGRSEGTPSRHGALLDAEAALDWLLRRAASEASPVHLFGQSIGGVIAAVLAARRRGELCGVVLDSAFTGYRDIARHHIVRNPVMLMLAWWYPLLVPSGLDAIECIDQVSPTPLLILHGRADRIVPWEMSQRLFDAANEPKELWLIDDMDHTEVWEARFHEARTRVTGFFDRCAALRQSVG